LNPSCEQKKVSQILCPFWERAYNTFEECKVGYSE
jgi:hypothetical protein